jgi:hypothetical protein
MIRAGWGPFMLSPIMHAGVDPEPDPVHPAPWWYRLAALVVPGRCRVVPESLRPSQVLLRQVALVSRRVYLQGFASGEHIDWAHSHGAWVLVLGLYGACSEWRPGRTKARSAPYCYLMAPGEFHQVVAPTPGHTSIAIYFAEPARFYAPVAAIKHWTEHVRKRVRRV